MKNDSLRALFINELREAYDVEHQIERALPKVLEHVSHPELKDAIHLHLSQTKEQARRLDRCFEVLGEKAKAEDSEGMKGIIKGAEHLMKQDGDPSVIDAGIIAAAQKVEHFEIATYGTLCTYAQMIGEQECVSLLKQTLAEEKEADRKFTEVAERVVNVDAMRAVGGGAAYRES